MKILIFSLLFVLVKSKISYNGYKVYSVIPETVDQVKALNDLEEQRLYDFWTDLTFVGGDSRIMVAPERDEDFNTYIRSNKLKADVQIDNVQKLIDAQLKPAYNGRNVNGFGWVQYHTLDEIYAWLDGLAVSYPDVVSVVVIGRSNEEREIKGVVIDFKQRGNESVIGMIEGGIHAREWISPATVTWIINEFLTSSDPEIRFLAEAVVWHLFPVTNPDGYSYTHQTNRMWRKNRNPTNFTTCPSGNHDMSNGVDLNRNFGFHWMETGATLNPCDEIFAGSYAFSEPESVAISEHVLSLKTQGQFIYYIAFHSFAQMVLVPFSHATGMGVLEADNYADMYEIAIRGMDKLSERYGTIYTVGTSAEILYPVSGSSFDWVKGEAEIPVVYLLELRDNGTDGFLLPSEEIIPNNLEIMDGLIEMDKVTRRLGYYTGSTSAIISSTLLLTGIVLITVLFEL